MRQEVEFDNRVQEVLSYDVTAINDKRAAEALIDRIVSVVDFVEQHKEYQQYIIHIRRNNRLVEKERELAEYGNEAIDLVRKMFGATTKFIDDNQMKLPTQEEVMAKHMDGGVYSPTIIESLGGDVDALRKNLQQTNISIELVDRIVADLLHTKWDFESLGFKDIYSETDFDELVSMREGLGKKQEENSRLKRHFGITDYETIKGIYDWRVNPVFSIDSIRFELSEVGKCLKGQSNIWNYSGVKSELTKYKECVRTFHARIKEEVIGRKETWWRKTFSLAANIIKPLIGTLLSLLRLR